MKQPINYLFSMLLISPNITLATESQHWVCESEALYRQLLSANLYGVGSQPQRGCQKLPTGVAIEQLACEITDLKLCKYRWEGMPEVEMFWGSPVIMPSDAQPNR
ncbi:MAG TPA: hypothetical protein VLA39_09440 [Marinobacterium sp.]|nr:hypothetical protein [Marinobacterium sp.]